MELVAIVTLLIVTLVLLYQTNLFSSEVTYVTSQVDQEKYIVLNLPDKQHAADILAHLKAKLVNFVKQLDQTVIVDDKRDKIKRIQHKFKAVLSEARQGSKYTSYTVNKGTVIHMCLREKDESNNMIDENTLFFVALHELAHVMTVSIGHTEEFWNNFKYLLKQAIKLGYYNYHPYHISPKKYCGTMITDTPFKI